MDDFNLLGVDLFGNPIVPETKSPLKEKFLFPPFSVIDTKQGEWQERKRAWISIGLESEKGRDAKDAVGGLMAAMNKYDEGRGKKSKRTESTTSIFDPVLCELIYKWFSPSSGMVVDPFAGGSVRGVIAALMGLEYTGVELRGEQVIENIKQAEILCPDHKPLWIEGDSNNIKELTRNTQADLVMSCPPYGYLEKYSDDPRDLSNMTYDDFLTGYRNIIKETCSLLKNDSFACFVVGNFRDKKGNYHDFTGDTITAFIDSGLNFYNDAVLLNNPGTACLRADRQFDAGRKLVKIHQNILVFVKGCGKKATQKIINRN